MKDFFAAVAQHQVHQQLNENGFVCIRQMLPQTICQNLIQGYNDEQRYRSTIDMARYNFGEGQYRYFNYPLPEPLAEIRSQCYQFLLPLARQWALLLNEPNEYPETHAEYLQQCHKAGQTRPTPLILHYQPGNYNCLHQDLYGDLVFPFQIIFMLSKPGRDFEGGELVITEQRPRMQSRAHVLTPKCGDAVVLAVHHRPKQGTRGFYRVNMRHGVSTLKKGLRYTLGVILHDAK